MPHLSRQRGSQWLLPREHGAYAEVLFPLVTASCSGRPSLSSVALSVAIITAFLAHEPLLVLVGARGGVQQRAAGARARSQGLILTASSLAAALLGLGCATPVVRWVAAALLPMAALALGLALAGREKSIWGEMLVALMFAFASVPVALATGTPLLAAARAAIAWSAVFIVGTGSVHALVARKKRDARAPSYVVLAVCTALSVVAFRLALTGQGWWLASAEPMLLVCTGALAVGLPPKRLKLLGWSMVIAQIGTAFALWLCFRSPDLIG